VEQTTLHPAMNRSGTKLQCRQLPAGHEPALTFGDRRHKQIGVHF